MNNGLDIIFLTSQEGFMRVLNWVYCSILHIIFTSIIVLFSTLVDIFTAHLKIPFEITMLNNLTGQEDQNMIRTVTSKIEEAAAEEEAGVEGVDVPVEADGEAVLDVEEQPTWVMWALVELYLTSSELAK